MRRTHATFYGSGRTPGHDGCVGRRGTSIGVPSQSIVRDALQLRSILESDQVNARIAKRLLHMAQQAGSAPGLAAAVLLVSEASRYRPALRRALTGGKGEGKNDDGGGGEGMGGEGGSSSLSLSYFYPSKRDQNILLDLDFLRR